MTREQLHQDHIVRNSSTRKFTSGPMNRLADYVHHRYPSLMPNEVSARGVIGVAETAYKAIDHAQNNTETLSLEFIKTVIEYVYYNLHDMFDGALARYLKEQGVELDGNLGQIVDASCDRLQELILALSRIAQAFDRHDLLGALLGLTSALSNGAPSVVRAAAEEQGHPVPETGGNLLSAVGTRGGRFVTSSVSTFFPKTQRVIDALNTFANLYTVYRRYNIMREKRNAQPELSDQTRELAKRRKKTMAMLLGISAISAIGYSAWRLYAQNKK